MRNWHKIGVQRCPGASVTRFGRARRARGESLALAELEMSAGDSDMASICALVRVTAIHGHHVSFALLLRLGKRRGSIPFSSFFACPSGRAVPSENLCQTYHGPESKREFVDASFKQLLCSRFDSIGVFSV